MLDTMGLDDKEKEEKAALEEKRKAAGDPKLVGQISDSERTRLSELLKKEGEGKEEAKPTAAASAAPAGKK